MIGFKIIPRFSFDAFVNFRLRLVHQSVKKVCGISLDEYKMEQEYQMFIQTFRDFLLSRDPKLQRCIYCLRKKLRFLMMNLTK